MYVNNSLIILAKSYFFESTEFLSFIQCKLYSKWAEILDTESVNVTGERQKEKYYVLSSAR
jgi:hypothetical protein